MTIKLEHSSKRVVVKIENLNKTIPRNIRNGLYQIGKQLRQTASQSILKRPRSGRVYKYKGRKHVASRRGEAWANRSGKARKGISYNVRGASQLIYFNDVDYVEFLEDQNKLDRRAMWQSIKSNNRNIIRILSDKIGKSF